VIAPWALGLAVLALTGAAIVASSRRHGARRLDEEMSLLLLAVFLVLPFSWEHHLVLALPACLVCLDTFILAKQPAGRKTLAIASLFVLAWEIPFDDPSLAHGALVLIISIKTYAVAALWGLLALRLRRAAGDGAPA